MYFLTGHTGCVRTLLTFYSHIYASVGNCIVYTYCVFVFDYF